MNKKHDFFKADIYSVLPFSLKKGLIISQCKKTYSQLVECRSVYSRLTISTRIPQSCPYFFIHNKMIFTLLCYNGLCIPLYISITIIQQK